MDPIDTQLFGTVHRTSKINSKMKGNRNELAVTKILSDWTGHEFVRVPMSGGLRWKNRMDICGDVINADTDFDFPFSVETKAVANLGLHKVEGTKAIRNNSIIFTYFNQCERDAKAAGKIPFLIIRQNNMSTGSYYIFLDLKMEQLMKICNYIQPKFYGGTLTGFHSKDFFERIHYALLKWIYGK